MNTTDTAQLDGRTVRCFMRYIKKAAYVLTLSDDRLKVHMLALGGDGRDIRKTLEAVNVSELPTDEHGLNKSKATRRKKMRNENTKTLIETKLDNIRRKKGGGESTTNISDAEEKVAGAEWEAADANEEKSAQDWYDASDPGGVLQKFKSDFESEFLHTSVRPQLSGDEYGVSMTEVPYTHLGDTLIDGVLQLFDSGELLETNLTLYDMRGVADEVIDRCFMESKSESKFCYKPTDSERRDYEQQTEIVGIGRAIANYDRAVAKKIKLRKLARGAWGQSRTGMSYIPGCTMNIVIDSNVYTGKEIAVRLLRGQGFTPQQISSATSTRVSCNEPPTASSKTKFEQLCLKWRRVDEYVSRMQGLPPRVEREVVAQLISTYPQKKPTEIRNVVFNVTPYKGSNTIGSYRWVTNNISRRQRWMRLHSKTKETLRSELKWVREMTDAHSSVDTDADGRKRKR
jgi:hypothetical protein